MFSKRNKRNISAFWSKKKCLIIGKYVRILAWTLQLSSTPQPLYSTVRYNTVLYITRLKDGSQKCIDYIEK